MCRIYNGLQTLPCIEYSTRNKQRNGEKKSNAKNFWEETHSNECKKMGFDNDNNTIILWNSKSKTNKLCRQEHMYALELSTFGASLIQSNINIKCWKTTRLRFFKYLQILTIWKIAPTKIGT